jgi:hypothetical protein
MPYRCMLRVIVQRFGLSEVEAISGVRSVFVRNGYTYGYLFNDRRGARYKSCKIVRLSFALDRSEMPNRATLLNRLGEVAKFPNSRKRKRPWTCAEKIRLINGMNRYNSTSDMYSRIYHNFAYGFVFCRSNVQMKDCWRVMERKNEGESYHDMAMRWQPSDFEAIDRLRYLREFDNDISEEQWHHYMDLVALDTYLMRGQTEYSLPEDEDFEERRFEDVSEAADSGSLVIRDGAMRSWRSEGTHLAQRTGRVYLSTDDELLPSSHFISQLSSRGLTDGSEHALPMRVRSDEDDAASSEEIPYYRSDSGDTPEDYSLVGENVENARSMFAENAAISAADIDGQSSAVSCVSLADDSVNSAVHEHTEFSLSLIAALSASEDLVGEIHDTHTAPTLDTFSGNVADTEAFVGSDTGALIQQSAVEPVNVPVNDLAESQVSAAEVNDELPSAQAASLNEQVQGQVQRQEGGQMPTEESVAQDASVSVRVPRRNDGLGSVTKREKALSKLRSVYGTTGFWSYQPRVKFFFGKNRPTPRDWDDFLDNLVLRGILIREQAGRKGYFRFR